ncbi:extracellular solute-binding protein [Dendrosporobacter sp. 1207_IL3150]|uniref:extracellular solute-binding protein n=1 Tax=Dendrosporobacter sp. 1207_IL3150 TaxID=3084054 RepID=UPI002FDB0601
MRRYKPLFWVTFIILVVVIAGNSYLAGYADRRNPKNMKSITVYTSLPVEQAAVLAQEYEKSSNLQVKIVPLSEKDIITRINLEQEDPRADIILTSSTLLDSLKKDAQLSSYTSEQTDIVYERFKEEHGYWTGVWYDPIVLAANKDFIKGFNQIPTKWSDLTKDDQVRIGITDFLAADAAANLLFSLVSANGEEKAFDFLSKIHPKVIQYAKFLATPVRMAGMGEVDIAIAVQSESIRYVNDGFPVNIIYPEEGTAYILTGVAMVKGAQHGPEAKQFIDWLLQDSAQAVLQQNKFFFIPTNPEITSYKSYTNKSIELLDNKSVTTAEEKRLILDKWVQNVRLSSRKQ